MSAPKTVEDHLIIARAHLLENGGVDSWEWYSDSLDDADYKKIEDPLEDAQNFLDALDDGGVRNWHWYGESITGLTEYEEYLESLNETGNLGNAENVLTWKIQYEAEEQAKREAELEAKQNEAAKLAELEANKRRVPSGPSEEWLYSHIAEKYGETRALDIFEQAITNGLWKRNTFLAEFKQVMKNRSASAGPDFMEESRKLMLAKLEKNGKLASFLAEAAN